MCTQLLCSHTSVYVYIEHVLLFTNIDCTWFKYRKVLFIRPRDDQIFFPLNTSPMQRFNAHLINSLCFSYPSLYLNVSVFYVCTNNIPWKILLIKLIKTFLPTKPIFDTMVNMILYIILVYFLTLYAVFFNFVSLSRSVRLVILFIYVTDEPNLFCLCICFDNG